MSDHHEYKPGDDVQVFMPGDDTWYRAVVEYVDPGEHRPDGFPVVHCKLLNCPRWTKARVSLNPHIGQGRPNLYKIVPLYPKHLPRKGT